MHRPDVLILGASTRAAAFSAARAGYAPACLDQFVDADLQGISHASRWDPDRDEEETARAAAALGCGQWFYTGSVEGRPSLVGRIAQRQRLLGNGPETLRRVRDPWLVTEALRNEGLPTLDVPDPSARPKSGRRWVRKHPGTAGGLGVSWATDSREAAPSGSYLQEYAEGPVFSGLFIGASGKARLVGTARQFQGGPASPFVYRGSVARWPLAESAQSLVVRIGEVLARAFGLVGLFGIDFALRDDLPWLLEVNPRYTASVELFELSRHRALLLDHVRACVEHDLDETPPEPAGEGAVGKRVLYATRELRFPGVDLAPWSPEVIFAIPEVADVPHAGSIVPAGGPIMTLLAAAETPERCVAVLDERERAWIERLGRPFVMSSRDSAGPRPPATAPMSP